MKRTSYEDRLSHHLLLLFREADSRARIARSCDSRRYWEGYAEFLRGQLKNLISPPPSSSPFANDQGGEA